MAITPSGKTRVMVAQTFGNPLSEGFEHHDPNQQEHSEIEQNNSTMDNGSSLETEDALNEDVGENEAMPENNPMSLKNDSNSAITNDSTGKKKTLTNYVFSKLESWGYPGRRLQEFKSKFVKETVSAEGIKDVQVEIPDKKYPGRDGITETVENDELKEISQEVNKLFGLNFGGAERSDGKWTIKFTSQKITSDEEEGMAHDNLDEVYGTPSGSGKEKRPGKAKVAFTVQEMFDSQKDNIVSQLRKITGA